MKVGQGKEFFIKYKPFLVPIFSGLVSIVVLALVIFPQMLSYLDTRKQISGVGQESRFLEVKAQELEQLDETALKDNLGITLSVLPSDRDVPQAMLVLQDLLSKSGLVLKGTAYINSKGRSDNSFTLNLVVAGQLASVRNFLAALQNSGRVFQLESINVQFQRREAAVQAEIPVAVYFESLPGKIGSSDQPVPKLSDLEEEFLSELSRLNSNLALRGITGEATMSSIPLGKVNPFE